MYQFASVIKVKTGTVQTDIRDFGKLYPSLDYKQNAVLEQPHTVSKSKWIIAGKHPLIVWEEQLTSQQEQLIVGKIHLKNHIMTIYNKIIYNMSDFPFIFYVSSVKEMVWENSSVIKC